MTNKFDPFGDLELNFALILKSGKWSLKAGRHIKAKLARREIEATYGPEVADAVEGAIRAGRDPKPILERAKRDLDARNERERQLANPPPHHGSARWPSSSDLKPYLRPEDAFDDPRSILLGSFADDTQTNPTEQVHWDGDGHLLTIAPTRSGKGLTTIIPNLLRYEGSCVVLDPKGELFAATSKWRSTLGPVYRVAPLDRGSGKPVHKFNPLARVKSQSDARAIAQQIFPRDPKASSFFADDAVGIMTGIIMYVRYKAPPHRRTLATACQLGMLKGAELLARAKEMAAFPPSADAGRAILEKNAQYGLKVLQDTLSSKLYEWKDFDIQQSLNGSDFSFENLKDQTATVYVEIPFDMMKTFAGWLRVVLKSALDAMLANPRVPDLPVLFVLDEFLNIGPFPEYRDAIRTHAGASVRLWFFLQDLYSLEEHYPGNSWRPFLNCAVKQFFGINDADTAQLVGGYLGHKTLAIANTGNSYNMASRLGGWDGDGSADTNMSMNEGIQFLGRPLLTGDEVRELLGGWQGDGWRYGITDIAGVRPFKTRLVVCDKSEDCRKRIGMMPKGGNHDGRDNQPPDHQA